MKRKTSLLVGIIACLICCAFFLTDVRRYACKIYVERFLENETFNTITLETGLTEYVDIVKEYFLYRDYYDQITYEINYH